MLEAIIGLILWLIVAGVVWWAAQQLLALVPLGEPFKTLINILLVVLLVFIVLYVVVAVLGMAGIHVPMFAR